MNILVLHYLKTVIKKLIFVTFTLKKSNLHYTRGITPKRVTSGRAHLRGLAPGLHSSEETLQLWQAIDDTADLTGPGNEPRPPAPKACD